MADNTIKNLVNQFYNGALTALGTVGVRYATKAMGFKDPPVELKPKSIAMFGAEIATAQYGIKTLQDKNVIPKTIWT